MVSATTSADAGQARAGYSGNRRKPLMSAQVSAGNACHEQKPRPGAVRQDRRELRHLQAAREGRHLPLVPYDPPRFNDVPTLAVDTTDGYRPTLDEIASFARGADKGDTTPSELSDGTDE